MEKNDYLFIYSVVHPGRTDSGHAPPPRPMAGLEKTHSRHAARRMAGLKGFI